MSELLEHYRRILRIRRIEEAIAARYSEQKMRCPTHLSIGQEAVAVGVSACLKNADKAYSSHRAHAHYLAKGGSLDALISELYGKATGCTGGRGGSMHLSDLSVGFVASTAIVGNSIPLAVGNGLHQQVQKLDEISVTYFGEGATEEGAFYESANFAALRKLPVLFVCENNRYSVYSPLSVRQPDSRSIVTLANSIGLNAVEVDGNDVEQVVDATQSLLEGVRSGKGPALIECHTYRHREHCGPNFDDDLGYRPSEEVAHWISNDPLDRAYNKLLANGVSESLLRAMTTEIDSEVKQAFDFAESAPEPSEVNNGDYLYA
ncbi:thiamine pyrophosphate-dependent dehydrogenase E1 component subunit alpha [Alteromonas sp. KUL49]|uniref:thiamine pyrophosphate-dependent dehydrogenase E1 component subunit alpha n=1 Tax=Alteromonas sp. KUL49 TaxID=2480798 RepID=UPI00102F0115|nr:thiamine pyrophosphate-dependent dehydrogenase E1 component subunit alpha [Alteromonas sp. KUL49]TAP39685.1 thiamine pyrophosphate-dependent dehydrogenase E1 component subunit alpha [Alteromonas sp. KUL49]GEA11673.1 acetoin dehydrogenase [Alteromonas sp. KUL49]